MEEINTDDLVDELERFENEGAEKLSPREYGKLRGISPQLVYYYIRNKKIDLEPCICGRKVIDVEETDKFFALIKQKKANGLDIKHDEP